VKTCYNIKEVGKVLTDLLGYYKRNSKKMSDFEKKKTLNEIKQIQMILEKDLKLRGVI
jgi:hypothetical protein